MLARVHSNFFSLPSTVTKQVIMIVPWSFQWAITNISSELIDSASNLMLDVELANKQVKPVKGPVTLHILNLPSSVNWEVGLIISFMCFIIPSFVFHYSSVMQNLNWGSQTWGSSTCIVDLNWYYRPNYHLPSFSFLNKCIQFVVLLSYKRVFLLKVMLSWTIIRVSYVNNVATVLTWPASGYTLELGVNGLYS